MTTKDKPYISKHLIDCLFIPNNQGGRVPTLKGWSKDGLMQYDNLLKYDDKRLKEHIKRGGNVAVGLGRDDIIIIDPETKEVSEIALKMLPNNTYMEGTPSGGMHIFYRCKEIKENICVSKKIQGKETVYLDILTDKHQCHIYPSIYDDKRTGEKKPIKLINDVEIREVDADSIFKFVDEIRQIYGAQQGINSFYQNQHSTRKGSNKTPKDPQMNFNILRYETMHLNGYNKLRTGIGLQGDEYEPYVKALWYRAWGMPLKHEPIIQGGIYTDSRIHTMNILPSGHGKKNIIETSTKITEGLGFNIGRHTSTHPEQFVGTIRKRKPNKQEKEEGIHEDQIVKYKGILADDEVQIEEAQPLLSPKTPNQEESNRYLCTATDRVGKNKISKRLVDVHREDALEYYPNCVLNAFTQPHSFEAGVVMQGLARRMKKVYRPIKGVKLDDNFKARLSEDYFIHQKRIDEFTQKIIKNRDSLGTEKIQFPIDLIDLFDKLHKALLTLGLVFSDQGASYTQIVRYTIQEDLLVWATIQAFSKGQKEIDEHCLYGAFVDLYEIFFGELYFIETKCEGSIDYGENWKGAKDNDIEMFKWLLLKDAKSKEESNISIQDYLDKICEVYNVQERQASNIRNNHRKKKWIDQYKAPNESKIWLQEGNEANKKIDAIHVIHASTCVRDNIDFYYDCCDRISSIKSASITPIASKEKSNSPPIKLGKPNFNPEIFKDLGNRGVTI